MDITPAWRQWMEYGRDLHRYFMNRLRNAQDARDLTQEVYLRLLRARNHESLRDFRAYMYRTAAHVVYEFQHREREPHVSYDSEAVWTREEERHEGGDEPFEDLSARQTLQHRLERLGPQQQAIVVLALGEGLSYEQIAERLTLSTHTVKKYLKRALATLRREDWSAPPDRRRP